MNDDPSHALMDILVALLLIAISVPLILNRIPPNRWYGFRMSKAFLSDENWYLINQYGGKALAFWSLILLSVGLLKFFAPFDQMGGAWVAVRGVGPMIMCATAAIIQTLVYTSKV